MHFVAKLLMGIALLSALVAASPVPGAGNTIVSSLVEHGTAFLDTFLAGPRIATAVPASNDTDVDFVGHSIDPKVIAGQREKALALLPIGPCEGYEGCGLSFVKERKSIIGEAGQAIRNVTVSFEQVKASPITIKVNVTNNSTLPITLWKEVSPLSPHAADLGYFSYQTGIRNVQFGVRSRGQLHGYRPTTLGDLVQLNPGQSESAEVAIPFANDEQSKVWLEMLKLSKHIDLSMGANWAGIWAATKDQVMESDMGHEQSFDFWNDLYLPWKAALPGHQGEIYEVLPLKIE
ncbi:hypothetical protein FHETE_4193 [Fusarium heterosporum]|uniref:Uncharacterized protein n=1 Tax=Fusarium heterosporum TaxID=42747 RepID=A0A8H5WUX9_FUSHE|nr:hypothetical protein FHETE_4193 [Fusarium heterosporum]